MRTERLIIYLCVHSVSLSWISSAFGLMGMRNNPHDGANQFTSCQTLTRLYVSHHSTVINSRDTPKSWRS